MVVVSPALDKSLLDSLGNDFEAVSLFNETEDTDSVFSEMMCSRVVSTTAKDCKNEKTFLTREKLKQH